jgi:peptide deformylase
MENIIKMYPEKVLRKKSLKVERITDWEKNLLKEMAVAMKENNGIGLAAPQVGVNLRLVTAETPHGIIKIVNPVIEKQEGESILNEGCLSFPGITITVKRTEKIVVSGLNENGESLRFEAGGLMSHVFQHEIDHLNGKLIIDYLPFWERIKFHLGGKKSDSGAKM